MSHKIYATFDQVTEADRAAGALLDSGVKAERISIVVNEQHMREQDSLRETDMIPATPQTFDKLGASGSFDPLENNLRPAPAHIQGTNITDSADSVTNANLNTDHLSHLGVTTKSIADAAETAKKSALLGLGMGTIAALATLAVPGVGIVIGGGALAVGVAGLAASASSGSVSGGIVGYLKDQGIPAEAIEAYERAYKDGGAIIQVDLDDEAHRPDIETLLRQTGAQNVHDYGYVA